MSQRVRPEVQTSRKAPVTQKRPCWSTKPGGDPRNRPEPWAMKMNVNMIIPESGKVLRPPETAAHPSAFALVSSYPQWIR